MCIAEHQELRRSAEPHGIKSQRRGVNIKRRLAFGRKCCGSVLEC